MTYIITEKQFELLRDFMTYVWHTVHDGSKSHHEFWAKQLDELNIPFAVQNEAANLMEKRENGFFYFRGLLEKRDIKTRKEIQCF